MVYQGKYYPLCVLNLVYTSLSIPITVQDRILRQMAFLIELHMLVFYKSQSVKEEMLHGLS